MIHCRQASFEEVAQLVSWAADEGWNPGIDDARAFYSADPDGFLVACRQNDEPIAAISVIRQGDTSQGDPYGFLGLYICLPEHRGSGSGWQIWQAGMDYLGGHTVGLDGVVEQQANYRKSGFEFAWRNVRYSGSTQLVLKRNSADIDSTVTCRLAKSGDVTQLLNLDAQAGGVTRNQYLSAWFSNTDNRVTMLAERKRQDGTTDLLACGTIRQCLSGHKIGPLLCVEPGVEQALLCALVQHANAQQIILDVPELNAAAVSVAEGFGLAPVFETARMYRGRAPTPQMDNVYGVATLELG